MDEDLQEFKSVARSLLIPHRYGLTASKFYKTYEREMGTWIPYKELGHSDPMALMKSIPEAVQVRELDRGRQVLFLPVVTEATEHVRRAVVSQNVVGLDKNPTLASQLFCRIKEEDWKNEYIPEDSRCFYENKGYYNKAKPQRVPDNIKRNIIRLLQRSAEGIGADGFQDAFKGHFKEDLDYKGLGYQTILDLFFSIKEVKIVKTESQLVIQLKNEGPLQPIVSMPARVVHRKRNIIEKPEKISKRMANIFRRILQAHPEGLQPWNLSREYEEITSHRLDYQQMGYVGVIELAISEPTIFAIRKSDEDEWRLYESVGPSNIVLRNYLMQKIEDDILKLLKRSCVVMSFDSVRSLLQAEMEAQVAYRELSEEDINFVYLAVLRKLVKRGVRLKCLEIGTFLLSYDRKAQESQTSQNNLELAQQRFPRTNDGVEVVVLDINNPCNFFFCLNQNYQHMQVLMEELDLFYGTGDGGLPLYVDDCTAGVLCAAPYGDQGYHRARIISTTTKKTAWVLYVDFGTEDMVHLNQLRVLDPLFCQLPTQAIKGRLCGMCPTDSAMGWSHEICELFSEMTSNDKVLTATYQGSDDKMDAVIVDLYDLRAKANEQDISCRLKEFQKKQKTSNF